MRLGAKLRAGLGAYVVMNMVRDAGGEYRFVDEMLVGMGYPPKVADSIIERLERRGWIECGVSARSGWLTDTGRQAFLESRDAQ